MEKVNKTELKNFAIQSRRQLIDQVKTKALMYGIDEKNDLEIQEQYGQLMINDKPYPLYMKPAFNSLKNQLKQKGYKQLVEEVAYTWFNRIIAIRYMEVHDYLPEKVNVLSSSVGRVDPDILFEYETMDLPVKQEEIRELLDAGDTEGAYRKLFIAQCNTLNNILPFLFEQIQDYTELLLPDFLLDAESVIKVLVQNDELTNSFDEIEVIGWLYQYYIAEEKDRVFAQKSKYKKEEIPFATQLFTPKWIVQYMVQNSLGRYWTEAHREDEDLISNWEYFIKHEEEDFHEKIAPYVNKELRVEDIKLLDPAMGSGHILVYAFEVFHQIYEKCGYPERDIPRLIIENNLYGLDIDDRAYQLAAFAVVMKASSYSRRFLRSVEREGIRLNLASIQETNYISDNVIAYIAQEEEGQLYNQVKSFINQYHNAKAYGSLINITERDMTFIEERLEYIQNNPVEDLFYGEQHDIAKEVLPALVRQTKIMWNEYDIVVMNPPYMGLGNMSKELGDFLKKYYPDSKADLFAAFMEKGFTYLVPNGFNTQVTMQSWMFLSSFEVFRKSILNYKTIDTLLHMNNNVMEIAFSTAATIIRNNKIDKFKGIYTEIKYSDLNYEHKPKEFPNYANRFGIVDSNKFNDITGSPIAYWLSDSTIDIFKNQSNIEKFADTKKGILTGNDPLFVRFWFEVPFNKIATNKKEKDIKKWFLQTSGGKFRRWYGNLETVVNMENGGESIKETSKNYRLRDSKYYFLEGITWSEVSNKGFSARYVPEGTIFGNGGPMAFPHENVFFLLGILNSKVSDYFLKLLASTVNFGPDQIKRIPLISENIDEIEEISKKCVGLVKKWWDYKETSIGFSIHPLLNFKTRYISEANDKYLESNLIDRMELSSLESKLNSIIIKMYSLEDIINPEIDELFISIEKITTTDNVKSFLSYFIGSLTGRFPLNNSNDIKMNLINFTGKIYYDDDIIILLRNFISLHFSADAVDENMQWLAETLEMKNGEDAEARLRRYFLDEFFTEHCKMYQKRPIYWFVDSGKQKGLRTLIYMHRYQPDTMATIRFEHLQEIQAKYQNEITDLENRLVNPNLSASEKKKLTAEKTSFERKMDELQEFDKRLAEVANEEIEIDLDDGVKVNYEKFYRGGKGVLAKIK